MINIEPSTAFLLYLGIFLIVLATLWLTNNRRRISYRTPSDTHQVTTCEYCTHGYICPRDRPLSRCPQCHALNKIPSST